MRRKQSMQHLDHRQLLMLENAYYQVGPIYTFVLSPSPDHLSSAILRSENHAKSKNAHPWLCLFDI